MYAVLGGFTELVRKLLEYGADMTIKNENNETFYNLATTVGNQAGCFAMLLHLSCNLAWL